MQKNPQAQAGGLCQNRGEGRHILPFRQRGVEQDITVHHPAEQQRLAQCWPRQRGGRQAGKLP